MIRGQMGGGTLGWEISCALVCIILEKFNNRDGSVAIAAARAEQGHPGVPPEQRLRGHREGLRRGGPAQHRRRRP